MIAGLLKAPSRYNPARNPNLAHKRARLVLDGMVDAGYIKPSKAKRAKRLKLAARPRDTGSGTRFFADWILDRVRSYVGFSGRDLVVHTTLRPRLQQIATSKAAALLKKESARTRARQLALVTMAPDGAVRVMIGGRNYGKSQFNRATQALRQPGSVFKPVVYLAALESGLDPDTHFLDGPVSVGKWRPGNFGGKYYGDVTMREAVTRSLNSVAVRASEKIGRRRVIDAAKRLGITSRLRPHPSIALGASEVSLLEMTAAYAVFANGGTGVWPYGIREIRDRGGQVLYRRKGTGPGRVIKSARASEMNDLLGSVMAWGTGKAARIGRPAAGKTGTSQDFRDAWFIGYTPDLVTGVWMGNDDGTPMNEVTGGGLPARLWRSFMLEAHKGVPAKFLPASRASATSELSRLPGPRASVRTPDQDLKHDQRPDLEHGDRIGQRQLRPAEEMADDGAGQARGRQLKKAEERRGRARLFLIRADGAGHAVRQHHAHGHHVHTHGSDHGADMRNLGPGQHGDEPAGNDAENGRARDHGLDAEAQRQPSGDQSAENVAQRQQCEVIAVMLGRHAENGDQHEAEPERNMNSAL